jgi:Holliday junction DNA helicase RuvA
LYVKEDVQVLYGFWEQIEKRLFLQLISVSGIGPSTGMVMLSSLSGQEIKEAIVGGDVKTIQSVKGIGAKTAQRVIIDLKDRILKTFSIDEVSFSASNTNKDEALSALEVLGFQRKQSDKIMISILKDNPDASVEQLIKLALKSL